MKKVILIVGMLASSFAVAGKVNIQCWSGDHLIYNDIVSEWKVNIEPNYVLVNKGDQAHIILGDCVLSKRLEKKAH